MKVEEKGVLFAPIAVAPDLSVWLRQGDWASFRRFLARTVQRWSSPPLDSAEQGEPTGSLHNPSPFLLSSLLLWAQVLWSRPTCTRADRG